MSTVVQQPGVDSPYAWRLAFLSMFCIGLGGGATYLPVVALKEIAAEFGDRRAVPSMAYMLGFFAMGAGGVFMGWLADRTSPRVPLLIAGVSILAGGWLTVSDGEWALYAGYAIPLGFLIGMSPLINKALDPFIQILKPISPLAWTWLTLVPSMTRTSGPAPGPSPTMMSGTPSPLK